MSRRLPILVLALSVLASAVGGCASLAPERFAGVSPRLDPMAFFTGRTRSWGVLENRAGQPARRFSTVCNGRREASGALRLDQTFTYEDGRTQQRSWRIRRVDAHRFEATASDVVGPGVGEAYGNAFHWEYTVALQPGNPLSHVDLEHWMYLQAGGQTLMNRAVVRKLGVPVAQVTELFWREGVSRSTPARPTP